MARDPQSEPKAHISKLPLPVSDSPLVIDLPDGQKIVVGKMTPGSVIEVATWRGVGRPDSRTSRLMLGVGSGNVNSSQDEDSDAHVQPRAKKPADWRVIFFYLSKTYSNLTSANLWKNLFQIKALRKSARVGSNSSHASAKEWSRPRERSNSTAAMDADIEDWLNKVSNKPRVKSAPARATRASSAAAQRNSKAKSAKPKTKRR